MYIIKYKALFVTVSAVLVAVSLILVATLGIKKGIDFTGGSVVDIAYQGTSPSLEAAMFKEKNIDLYNTGNGTYRFISAEAYETINPVINLLANPKGDTPFTFTQVNTVGPTIGAEMTKKAIIALVIVVLAILLFIAFSFREVSYPVSSWKYGVIAMVTLIHDIVIPTGIYTLLSKKYGAEIDTFFVIALLTIIGISISDKIVVFDRIRENLKVGKEKRSFDEVVGASLSQTFTRSINTSVTVILALLALFFYGPVMTKWFTLTLIVGMIVGTYSSIFVASPLLTYWNKKK
jgi:preprotein translocase subunit SecF